MTTPIPEQIANIETNGTNEINAKILVLNNSILDINNQIQSFENLIAQLNLQKDETLAKIALLEEANIKFDDTIANLQSQIPPT